jgi:hypothetical protein
MLAFDFHGSLAAAAAMQAARTPLTYPKPSAGSTPKSARQNLRDDVIGRITSPASILATRSPARYFSLVLVNAPCPSRKTGFCMSDKEATARIKINKLLETAGWRFFAADGSPASKTFFNAYVTSDQIRHIIETGQFTDLATNPVFSTRDFRAVPTKYRKLIPEYVKDYVSLNQFVA